MYLHYNVSAHLVAVIVNTDVAGERLTQEDVSVGETKTNLPNCEEVF